MINFSHMTPRENKVFYKEKKKNTEETNTNRQTEGNRLCLACYHYLTGYNNVVKCPGQDFDCYSNTKVNL